MKKVIYEHRQGSGITLENENESDFIEKKSIVLHGEVLDPDDYSSLDGYFERRLRYAGHLKNEDQTVICFFAGTVEGISYYYCLFWLNENRIGTKYSEGSFRDFIFHNGRWK